MRPENKSLLQDLGKETDMATGKPASFSPMEQKTKATEKEGKLYVPKEPVKIHHSWGNRREGKNTLS